MRSLVAVGDSRSHMMELRVTPAQGDWLIGEAVTVKLLAGERMPRTTVARDALVLRDRSNYVFVVREDNTAQRVVVEHYAVSNDFFPQLDSLPSGVRSYSSQYCFHTCR